ncbi:hypothetical protein [Micromonospora ureilytica]|uniref:Uncharacterized protein n=1 Tax=Micromonospora ureilytica TaxID=709868 RepID=A0ABS0JLC1_9ACTN|nr:hypothetical protein [Micromonospora ureilytica]MBG6067851.1 hypothetical protein [Micromonospora ureilytica]
MSTTPAHAAAPRSRWRRKVLGVPLFIAVPAVFLLVPSIALAAVLFFAKANISGQIKSTPTYTWANVTVVASDGMVDPSVTASGSSLALNVGSAYPGATLTFTARIAAPADAPSAKITGVEFGTQLTAAFASDSPAKIGSTISTSTPADVKITVTVPDTATAATLSGSVSGVTLAPTA